MNTSANVTVNNCSTWIKNDTVQTCQHSTNLFTVVSLLDIVILAGREDVPPEPQVNNFYLLFIQDGHDSPEQLCQGSQRSMLWVYLPGQGLNPKQAPMAEALPGKAGSEQTEDKVM